MTKEIPRVAKNPADALLYHLMLQMAVTHILHRAKPVLVKDEDIGAILGKILDKYAVERDAYVIEDERERDPDARLEEGKIVKSFADFATDETIKKMAEELHLKLTAHTDVKNISIEDVEYALKKARDLAKKIVREHLENKVEPDHLKKNPFIALALHDEEIIRFLAGFREDEVVPKKGEESKEAQAQQPAQSKIHTETNHFSLTFEAQKLLGVLNGLKYAGYSKEAVGSAVEDMFKRAEELAEKGELEVLALYLWTAHLLREGRFEDAEKFLKKES